MNTLLDTYIANYHTYPKGKVTLECEKGEVIFWKEARPNTLTVFGIYVHPAYQNQGLCSSFIKHLICVGKQTPWCNKVAVVSVLSKPLYEFLMRFQYGGYTFDCKNDGFYCRVDVEPLHSFGKSVNASPMGL